MSDSRLEELRKHLDRLDGALVYLLAERFACTEEIGTLKRNLDLPALDAVREEQQRSRLRQIATEAGLEPESAVAVFSTITERVRKRHEQIRTEDSTLL